MFGKTKPDNPSSATRRAPQEKSGPAVLFVCTANIVRSPMAAALLWARLRQEQPDWQLWRVDSAGTWANDGDSAAKNTVLVLQQRGLDISDHHSRTVTAEMLASYPLILTMEPGHKEALQVEFAYIAKRVFLLSEMAGQRVAVEDPYGGPLEAYEETARKIDQMLERGWERIVQLANLK